MTTQFCQKCGRLAEFDPYYNRYYCTQCTNSWEVPRTNYDVLYTPTIEEAAKNRLIPHFIDKYGTFQSRRVDFYTSDGSIFYDEDEAIAHEIWWLQQPAQ
jgi:hypothetical protein